ncbi:MAG TPA: hypothetical protein VER12_15290 [Polyangiaceae bacterium]|nr:hypothetical protein [Polyangiaceae bacterium]
MVTGQCHCGKTSFRIDGDLPPTVTRCTCSICSKRGGLYAYYHPDQFAVRAKVDRIYRWNSQLVSSHFCGECGCATYNESPAFALDGSWDSKRRVIAVNARLLDNFNVDQVQVTVVDGKSRMLQGVPQCES